MKTAEDDCGTCNSGTCLGCLYESLDETLIVIPTCIYFYRKLCEPCKKLKSISCNTYEEKQREARTDLLFRFARDSN